MAGKTIELPKLPDMMSREDVLMAIPGPVIGEGSLEKQKEFIRLINEEKKNLGLPEVHIRERGDMKNEPGVFILYFVCIIWMGFLKDIALEKITHEAINQNIARSNIR